MSSEWAPLSYSPEGVPEIDPTWVDANRSTLQILDVREPAEFNGPLGHIPGAKLIPLGQLSGRLAELSRDQPIVAVCRSGARSAQATEILCSAGFIQVANLPGGMLRWRQEGRAS
jgi:sulfur dioxygenase